MSSILKYLKKYAKIPQQDQKDIEKKSEANPISISKEKAEDILKGFDLDVTYGPCIGLTRNDRYNRAVKLGLNPDPSIPRLIDYVMNSKSVLSEITNKNK